MIEIINKRLKELEKKAAKYNNEYQNSGSDSALRTYEKYDDLCEICRIALRGKAEEDEMRMRIQKNMTHFIEKFKESAQFSRSKTYTNEEVVKLLERMKNLV